jgi:hypothetical protein
MLFNLSQQRHFKNHGTGDEIYCDSACGPCYGCAELAAHYQLFNGDGNCRSYANNNTYKIPEDKDGKNMLTNKRIAYFLITEIKV